MPVEARRGRSEEKIRGGRMTSTSFCRSRRASSEIEQQRHPRVQALDVGGSWPHHGRPRTITHEVRTRRPSRMAIDRRGTSHDCSVPADWPAHQARRSLTTHQPMIARCGMTERTGDARSVQPIESRLDMYRLWGATAHCNKTKHSYDPVHIIHPHSLPHLHTTLHDVHSYLDPRTLRGH